MRMTTKPFERSHGKRPRGEGTWAFQASRSDVAFDRDRFGEVVFAFGTPAVAFREAVAKLPADCVAVAVLP